MNAHCLQYESLIKEVRKLQGDLADYNLIVDKSRTKTDPQEIALVYQQLKARNDAERRRVDEVFSERHEKEQDIKQVEQEIAQVQSVAEEKLNMLSQQQRMDYAQLQDDYSRLEADIQQKQTTYDNLCRQVAKYEQELQQEPNKQRSASHIHGRILFHSWACPWVSWHIHGQKPKNQQSVSFSKFATPARFHCAP
jgi:chromosome segregation ATPase